MAKIHAKAIHTSTEEREELHTVTNINTDSCCYLSNFYSYFDNKATLYYDDSVEATTIDKFLINFKVWKKYFVLMLFL